MPLPRSSKVDASVVDVVQDKPCSHSFSQPPCEVVVKYDIDSCTPWLLPMTQTCILQTIVPLLLFLYDIVVVRQVGLRMEEVIEAVDVLEEVGLSFTQVGGSGSRNQGRCCRDRFGVFIIKVGSRSCHRGRMRSRQASLSCSLACTVKAGAVKGGTSSRSRLKASQPHFGSRFWPAELSWELVELGLFIPH